MKPANIHLWAPQISSFKGGIQVFSGFLAKAIREVLPETKLTVLMKHEGRLHPSRPVAGTSAVPMPIRTLAFASLLAGRALLERPDLIISTHIHFAPVAQMVKRLNKTPYWLVAHGVEAWGPLSPMLARAISEADRVLAVSAYTAERLISLGIVAQNRVSVFHNTYQETAFAPAPKKQALLDRYNLSASTPLILTLTRLDSREKYKGYDKMVEALPKIIEVIPDVRFMIAGTGDDRARVESLARSLRLEDRVLFTGFIPDNEVCDHLNLCDLFAMPSLGEGFGIVFLEALACGKPVLAGNQDGSVDALRNGELGFLIDPRDISILADTVIKILSRRMAHPIAYCPNELALEVKRHFGFDRFARSLSQELSRP